MKLEGIPLDQRPEVIAAEFIKDLRLGKIGDDILNSFMAGYRDAGTGKVDSRKHLIPDQGDQDIFGQLEA